MENLFTTITLTVFFLLLASPFLLLRILRKSGAHHFYNYLIPGLSIIAILSLLFAWWCDTSTLLLLKHYDAYHIDPDTNSGEISYQNVLPQHKETVKNLEMSYMGIGWPLRAIFMCMVLFPYVLMAYFLDSLFRGFGRKTA